MALGKLTDYDEFKGKEMETVTLVLILLASFNLSMLVMKVWGDRFPQPHARNMHANWLQSWRNTQKPQRRFWVQIIVMFLVMMLFITTNEIFVGFLVFGRLIIYCMGYKRAKQQNIQALSGMQSR